MDDTTAQFAEVWMKSRHAVSSFVRSIIRDQHDAEDIVQSVAIAAAKNFDKYDTARPFANWVIGIARRQVAQHLRVKYRDRHVFGDQVIAEIANAHEDLASELNDRITALNFCLKKLTERGQKIIEMRYMQNMSPQRIAETVGTSYGAIVNLLYRLRSKLGECIRSQMACEEGRR